MREKVLFDILKKIGQFVLTMLVLIVIVFLISRMTPGDPLKAYYGESLERMSLSQQEAARERLGLSDAFPVQFVRWAEAALHGDFGISFQYKQDVLLVVGKVWGNTLVLTLICALLIFGCALLLAIFCVGREGRLADRIICKVGVAANSVPEFLVALILMLVFCVGLKALPASGAYDIGQAGDLLSRLKHLILPVLAVVISHLWYCAYLMRSKLSEEMRKEYVLRLRASGLSNARIYLHCIKNILPASISMMAIFLPHLLGGAYVVEMVFSYPGLGSLGFESVKYHDYNMIMMISMITGLAVILSNMAAQAINERIDPRMKAREGAYEKV